jgi:predicted transcriptional regulator of viral defense system
MRKKTISHTKQIFKIHQGVLRTSEALRLGVSPRTLYQMRDSGSLRQIARGVFQLTEQGLLGNPDWVNVAKKIPKAVVCLISALDYYGLTTQVPHKVYIALPRSAEKPRMDYPPLDIIWLSDLAYSAGITELKVDEIPIKVYSIEKTIADCFKFRNKIGIDVALDALKQYLKTIDRNIDRLLYFSRIDRVESIVSIYLEAML